MNNDRSDILMNSYRSDIRLGTKYRDRLTGLEGTADSVHFYRNACERVMLTYLHDGDIKNATFDALDLIDVDTDVPAESPKTGGPERSTPPRR